MTAMEQEDHSPPPALSARYRFVHAAFARSKTTGETRRYLTSAWLPAKSSNLNPAVQSRVFRQLN
jgi:hypothetical protein